MTTEEDVWRRAVKLQFPENNSEQKDFMMTAIYGSLTARTWN